MSCLLVTALSGCKPGSTADPGFRGKPNILLIVIDDLRPELNCYGAGHILSPNIDALASESVLFTRAFTQQAVCAPSRNTLMTGLRPDGLGIHDLATFFRTKAPDVITLPQHFIQNGYQAEGMGKIYHTSHGNRDDSLSWTVPHWSADRLVERRDPVNRGDTSGLQTCYPTIAGRRLPWLKASMPEHLQSTGTCMMPPISLSPPRTSPIIFPRLLSQTGESSGGTMGCPQKKCSGKKMLLK